MIKKRIIIGFVILMLITNCCTMVNATTEKKVEVIQEMEKELTYLYNANFKDRMLQYDGKLVYSINVLNEKVEELEIEETAQYNNSQILNIILSGYPYKTPEELNCQDELEAYVATQEAIYIENEPRNLEKYVVKGERGQRIYEAAQQIVQEARKVTSIDQIKLIPKNEEFVEDNNDSNYLMKEYDMSTTNQIATGTIKIIAGEGVKITDLENQPKTNFREKDHFKILIPKDNTMQNISIKFDADFIKPNALLGSSLQTGKNYGLVIVDDQKENLSTYIDIKEGNLSTIKITNVDKDTKEAIIGSTFELLNQNYETIQDNLVTDENGEILINNLEQNTYYIRQKEVAQEYSLMNYLTKVEVVAEDRITNVKIINYKEAKAQVLENKEKEINVEEENTKIEEINNKEITNIFNNNTSKEVTDNIEEKNYYYNRDFINNIRIKNIQNEQNNDIYKNFWYEGTREKVYRNNIEDNNARTREDWINYIELKTSGTSLQKLPKAGI